MHVWIIYLSDIRMLPYFIFNTGKQQCCLARLVLLQTHKVPLPSVTNTNRMNLNSAKQSKSFNIHFRSGRRSVLSLKTTAFWRAAMKCYFSLRKWEKKWKHAQIFFWACIFLMHVVFCLRPSHHHLLYVRCELVFCSVFCINSWDASTATGAGETFSTWKQEKPA